MPLAPKPPRPRLSPAIIPGGVPRAAAPPGPPSGPKPAPGPPGPPPGGPPAMRWRRPSSSLDWDRPPLVLPFTWKTSSASPARAGSVGGARGSAAAAAAAAAAFSPSGVARTSAFWNPRPGPPGPPPWPPRPGPPPGVVPGGRLRKFGRSPPPRPPPAVLVGGGVPAAVGLGVTAVDAPASLPAFSPSRGISMVHSLKLPGLMSSWVWTGVNPNISTLTSQAPESRSIV